MSSFSSETSLSTTTDDQEYQLHHPHLKKDINNLLNSISSTLEHIIYHNTSIHHFQEHINHQLTSSFTSNIIPGISIYEYLLRIITLTQISQSFLIHSFILIDKLTSFSKIILTDYNVHRILFTSILLSIKYNDDVCFKMEYYAQIAGVSVDELFLMEYEFIQRIDFRIYVCEEEYEDYRKYLLDNGNDMDIENNNY